MNAKQDSHAMVMGALESVRKAAAQVRHCPACRSDRIYTALNVAYYFDHSTQAISLRSIMNLAEHGWHGCHACDHKWISNAMLQTALPPKTPTTIKNKVIDLAQHIKKPELDTHG